MFFSRQIHQFIAIARAGSFLRAANEIAVTSSALSHGMHDLEQRLGKKLIVRRKSGAFLTREGKELYNDIAPLYDKVTYVLNCTKNEKAKIVIGFDSIFNPTLPHKLDNLYRKFGDKIDIISGNVATPLEDVLDEKCDILLNVSFGLGNHFPENIYRIALPPERLGVLTSHKIKNKYKDPLEMLKHENIFQRVASLQHNAFKKIRKSMCDRSINSNFIGLPDLTDVIGVISLNMGICLVSDDALKHPALADSHLNFIELPKDLDLIINRGLYFKKEKFEELMEILTCIQNK